MNKGNIAKKVIFILGLLLCCYPLISSIVQQQAQKDTISTYQQMIDNSDTYSIEEEKEKVNEYNKTLFDYNTSVLSSDNLSILSEKNYNEILNIGNGVMGSIEIPKINVNLPIYHGVSEEVLSVGVGHVDGSSLPAGGINTKSILTGHRGLPSAKLFTRLDELELNDLFFIRVLNETLAYKVINIKVIEPEDVSSLDIESENDLVSLITCTPYGLNTHRLVVTAERTVYEKDVYDNIQNKSMSIREWIFLAIPFIFITILVWRRVKRNGRKKI
ncbi:MAG: class C sortase [Bacilli bacterium]